MSECRIYEIPLNDSGFFKIPFGDNGDYTLLDTYKYGKSLNPNLIGCLVKEKGFGTPLGKVSCVERISKAEYDKKTTILDDFYYSIDRLEFHKNKTEQENEVVVEVDEPISLYCCDCKRKSYYSLTELKYLKIKPICKHCFSENLLGVNRGKK